MSVELFRWLIMVSAALVATCLLTLLPRLRGRRDGLYLGLALGIELVCVLGYLGEQLSPDRTGKIIWDSIQLASQGGLSVAFYLFAASFVGRPVEAPRSFAAFLLAPTFAAAGFFASSPWHGLARTQARIEVGPMPHLVYPFEPFDYAIFVYMYVLLLASALLFVGSGSWRHRVYRRQVLTLTANVLAPAIGSALTFMGIQLLGERDLTPFFLGAGTLATTLGMLRPAGLDLSPLARDLWVEQQSDVVIVVDPRGCIVDFNRSAGQLLAGLSEAPNLIGRELADLLPGWAGKDERPSDSRRELDARIWEVRRFPVDAGTLLVARDVTALVENERAVVRLNQALEERIAERTAELERAAEENRRLAAERGHAERMEMLGRLAGGVAHDFNNLLTVILAASSVLRESHSDEPTLEVLTDLENATESATLVTRQLLAFSRGGTGKAENLNVHEVLRRCGKLLDRLLGERHHLRLELAPATPCVFMESGQLEQCVMNLVVNARDAMPQGGEILLRTELTTDEQKQRCLLLSITDQGTGMDERTQAHLFEAFYTTKPRGQGTGLGLANVQEAITAAQGSVRIVSALGKGSTFELRIPLAGASDEPAPVSSPSASGHERVLLVEDVERLRQMVADALRRAGYRVFDFASAEDALAQLPAHLDIVVTDVILPGLTGLELIERLEAAHGPIPTVFTTGYMGDSAVDVKARRDQRLLTKPYRTAELLRVLREVLEAPPV
ncbi:MAG TPA: histidine kinase N-terminal 7TM domain-containing protein [Polyangiaceae bacterium]|nr:histidine kinase N-terminal 7TM domain-containing protein [Polyangiaceae bacterium]